MHPEDKTEAVEGFSGTGERVKRRLPLVLPLLPLSHLCVYSRYGYPYKPLPWPEKVSLLEM